MTLVKKEGRNIDHFPPASGPDLYDETCIQQQLRPFGYTVKHFDEVDSTMDEALRVPNEKWVGVADFQRKGRGRRGAYQQREWQAEKFKSILLTINEPWDETKGDPPPISLIPSQLFILAACIALQETTGNPQIAVRYPSDLTVRRIHGKKLAGILVENHEYSPKKPYRKVFGIGLNVFNQQFGYTDYGAITLEQTCEGCLSRKDLVVAIVQKWSTFRNDLANFDDPEIFEKYNKLWQKNAAFTGHTIQITQNDGLILRGETLQSLLGQYIMLQSKTGAIFVNERYDVGTRIDVID